MSKLRRTFLALIVLVPSFGFAAETPLSYGMLVDNSASSRSALNDLIDAGLTAVAAHKPGDEAFILRYAGPENLSVMQTITKDKAALSDALENVFAEAGAPPLIDALYLAVGELGANADKKGARSKALLVLSAGEEGSSYYKTDDLMKLIGGKKIPVYFIVLASSGNKVAPALGELAAKTGGKVFLTKSKAERRASVAEFFAALRKP